MANGRAVLTFPRLWYFLLGTPGWVAVQSRRLRWESNAEGGRAVVWRCRVLGRRKVSEHCYVFCFGLTRLPVLADVEAHLVAIL
jgi:hypothetical protein